MGRAEGKGCPAQVRAELLPSQMLAAMRPICPALWSARGRCPRPFGTPPGYFGLNDIRALVHHSGPSIAGGEAQRAEGGRAPCFLPACDRRLP